MSSGRILHCIPTMAGGGAERQMAYLAAGLRDIGWDVHVALTRRGPNWDRLAASGAAIHEWPSRSAYDARVFGWMRRVILRSRPDILQAWLPQMEIVGGLAAVTRRTPWLLSERASRGAYTRTAKSVLRRITAQFASAIISNSAAGDEYWTHRVRSRVPRYVVPNAVPIEEIRVAPPAAIDAPGFTRVDPVLLFAGRLAAQKNIEVLLPALASVLARRAVHVLCCGEGPLRGRFERWIDEHDARRRVTMMGYVANLWGLMKRANVLIAPSLFEGNPNVVLEAMACGVPLVVSDIPEHRELLDERSALLVDPNSVEQLTAAIERVLDGPNEASVRADAAKRRVECHGLDAVARRYNDVYLDVLRGRGDP